MNQQAIDPAQVQNMMVAMVPLFGILFIVGIAALIVPFWVAFKKSGLSPFLSLLIFIPGLGLLITLYVLAFARWNVVPASADYGALPTNYPPQGYPPQPAYGGMYAPAAPVHGHTGYPSSPVYPPASTAADPSDPQGRL